jgi:hypothetical protein
MDEMFEALTLVQTGKVTRFPVVLLGTSYWRGLIDWLREPMVQDGKINPTDLELLCLTDDVDDAVQHLLDADATRPVPREESERAAGRPPVES